MKIEKELMKEYLVRKSIRCLLQSHEYTIEESIRILEELVATGKESNGEFGE